MITGRARDFEFQTWAWAPATIRLKNDQDSELPFCENVIQFWRSQEKLSWNEVIIVRFGAEKGCIREQRYKEVNICFYLSFYALFVANYAWAHVNICISKQVTLAVVPYIAAKSVVKQHDSEFSPVVGECRDVHVIDEAELERLVR